MRSRFLGDLILTGGLGGGVIDTTFQHDGEALPVRIEIDHPTRFDEKIVEDIDRVLQFFNYLDGLARDTIRAGLMVDTSAPSMLLNAWAAEQPNRDSRDTFIDSLRLRRLRILPDGGRESRERVLMAYTLAEDEFEREIAVRFMEPSGPELLPAPRDGYR